MKDELLSLLLRFSHDIINIVKNAKENEKIKKIKRLWIKRKIIDFKYEKNFISVVKSTEYIEKEEWNLVDKYQIILPEIKKLPLYMDILRKISEIYGIEEKQAELQLEHFVSYIIDNALNDNISDEIILESIVLFLDDLEQNPITWELKVWINGIWLEDEEIELTKGIKLRRLRPSDFEFEYPLEPMFCSFPETRLSFPSAVIELKQRAKNEFSILNKLEKIIMTLRLYKLGSIEKMVIKWKPKSILKPESITEYPIKQPIYEYTLNSNDVNKIKDLLNKIESMDYFNNQEKNKPLSYLSIALHRYNEALFRPNPIERLAYAIMGLEALYLKESGELAHKLAQRVAKCLGILNFHPIRVYENLKKAYKIRNKFIHGSPLDKNDLYKLSKLVDNIMEYLRCSILMFMELKGKKKKEEFIEIVDNSLLYQEDYDKLQELIKEHCYITLSLCSNNH